MAELNVTAGSDQLPNNADERSYASLANTRSFRRRVGERRISAPIRVVRSFVAALFDAIAGPEPSTWGDASNSTLTMSSDEFVHYISTNRYRLKENLTDEIAKNMFAEADLLNDGKLDQDEAANTAASCGIESVYLRYWCTLLNLFVDPYVQARAMPMRITKRHPMQANTEATEEVVMFKPNMAATQAHGKHPVTTRPASYASSLKRCDGRRSKASTAQQLSINDAITPADGSETTMGFSSQEQFSAALTLASDASAETTGRIAGHARQGSFYRPHPQRWLDAAMTELSWPAVPGSENPLTVPARMEPSRRGGGWDKSFRLQSKQDLRMQNALETASDNGGYTPPSEHKFRDEADPYAHGHRDNFQLHIANREPSVRPFESQRTGAYRPPASHSFRPETEATLPFETVFPPKPKHIDLGTGEKFGTLARDKIDPYVAHSAVPIGMTLNHMPKQTMQNIH